MERIVKVDGVRERLANLPRDWRLATTCSGCGTFELALRAVATAMSGYLPVDDDSIVVTGPLI